MIIYRHRQDAMRKGMDLVLSLTPRQTEALGMDAVDLGEAFDTVLAALASFRTGEIGCDESARPSLKDGRLDLDWLEWALRDVEHLTARLDGLKAALLRRHADVGGTYGAAAKAMGIPRSTAQRRRDSVTANAPSGAEQWVTDPRATVEASRPAEWTDPDVLTHGVTEGWAEPETDPARIDWPVRQATALLPFTIVNGRPVSPGPEVATRRGRGGFGRWAENPMADAMVTATDAHGVRRLLLIERDDGRGWAIPGGSIEPGETPARAASRELQEEAGLAIPDHCWQASAPRWVPDSRGTQEAWAVTVLHRHDLGTCNPLPDIHGSDDARQAAWVPAETWDQLTHTLQVRHGGQVFPAHADMIQSAIN